MLEEGFVKLHRSLLRWRWYQNQNTRDLYIHLLLTVNYIDMDWQGITVKRGQRICSLAGLSDELNMSVRSIRTALNHLISTGEVTKQIAPHYTMITVVDYDATQKATSEPTNDRQGTDKALTRQRQQCKKARTQESKKEKEGGEVPPAPLLGSFENVSLSDEQQTRLKQRLGGEAEAYIERLSLYMASKGRAYSNHYATLLRWWQDDHKNDRPELPAPEGKEGIYW